MKTIHKVAAVVIQENSFLMVRKKGKDIWTSLGGHIESGETEEQALLREIREELAVEGKIIKKLGDFQVPAIFDDATLVLSAYLVELIGVPHLSDPELEEFRFLDQDWKEKGVKLPPSISEEIIPYCIEKGLLDWNN